MKHNYKNMFNDSFNPNDLESNENILEIHKYNHDKNIAEIHIYNHDENEPLNEYLLTYIYDSCEDIVREYITGYSIAEVLLQFLVENQDVNFEYLKIEPLNPVMEV